MEDNPEEVATRSEGLTFTEVRKAQGKGKACASVLWQQSSEHTRAEGHSGIGADECGMSSLDVAGLSCQWDTWEEGAST